MSTDDTVTGEPSVTRAPRRGMVVRSLIVAGVAAMLLVLAIGEYLSTRADGASPTTEPVRATRDSTTFPPSTAPSTSTTAAPTTTTTIPPVIQQAALALPALPGGSVKSGSRGNEVWAYEARMVQLHFDPGPLDGVFDGKTKYAVEAVQKYYGLARNGVIDQATLDALANFTYAPLVPTGEADRVEIDLDKQTLSVYRGWQPVLITTTSTGNGKRFCGGSDGCQYAVTPPGKFAFKWHHNGWRQGKLGRLFNPWYFNGGIAVHGYSSVPVTPASHGCSRIPMHIAEYFSNLVFKDMVVYVVGAEAPRTGYANNTPNGGATAAPTTTVPVATDTTVPITEVPTTVPVPGAPTSAAPETTIPPVTVAAPPTTVAPVTTAPPTTSPPDTAAPAP